MTDESNSLMTEPDQLLRINQICDDVESRLQRGDAVVIEEVLASAAQQNVVDRASEYLLVELLALKIEYAENRDDAAASLAKKHPRHVEQISQFRAEPSLHGTLRKSQSKTFLSSSSTKRNSGEDVKLTLPDDHRFELRSQFASGGLGEVFVAWDRHIQREVALKTLKSQYVEADEARSRFNNESTITGRLEHPGIVPVYDSGVTERGQPYYAMRLLKGTTLKEAIAALHADRDGDKFPEKQRALLRRLIDVCDAISYAHDHGVIHRDLKPANILLGEYGETVVIDWGLARHILHSDVSHEEPPAESETVASSRPFETRIGSVLGTPEYMSPEQASGDSKLVGKPSDVFGLGAVLYSILCGESPSGDGPQETNQRIARAENAEHLSSRQRLGSVSTALDAICSRAMNPEPQQRYANPRELAVELENWLSDRPIAAKPDSLLDRSARFLRKHRRWAAAALATLVAITIGSVVVASVINGQSQQLAQRKTEAEEQAKKQQQLAAKEAEAHEDVRNYIIFVNDVFGNLNPDEFGRDAKLADVVAKLEEEYRSGSDHSLKTRHNILTTLASIYLVTRNDKKALEIIREFKEIAVDLWGENTIGVWKANASLVFALTNAEEFEAALKLASQTLPQLDEFIANEGSDDVGAAASLRPRDIADSVKVKLLNYRNECLKHLEKTDEYILAMEETHPWLRDLDIDSLPEDAEDLLHASQYVEALQKKGDTGTALQWQKKLYAAQKKISGAKNSKSLGNLFRLTRAVKRQEGHVASLPYGKELVDSASDVFGPTHPNTLVSRANYADSLKFAGQYEEAFIRLQVLQKQYHKRGKDDPNSLSLENKLASTMQSLGQDSEALELMESVVSRALSHQSMKPSSATALIGLYQLSLFQMNDGQLDAAIETIETEIGILKEAGREKETTTQGDVRWRLQLAYMKQGDLEKALKQREYFSGEVKYSTVKPSIQTAEILVDLNRFDEAMPILEKILLLEPNATDAPPKFEQLDAHKDNARGLLSTTLQAKDPPRARRLLTEAVDGLQGRHVWLHNIHVRDPLKRHGDALIALHESNGDADKAEALRSKLAKRERAQQ